MVFKLLNGVYRVGDRRLVNSVAAIIVTQKPYAGYNKNILEFKFTLLDSLGFWKSLSYSYVCVCICVCIRMCGCPQGNK